MLSDRKIMSGWSLCSFRDCPFPERNGFGVRLSTEDCNTLFNPIEDNRKQLVSRVSCQLAVKIERIDVLIFLGRVFSVVNGAIGVRWTTRMFFHIRMIGRALICQVKCNVDISLRASAISFYNRQRVPSSGMNGFVTAFFVANCPGRTGFTFAARTLLFFPFFRWSADRSGESGACTAHQIPWRNSRQQSNYVFERSMFSLPAMPNGETTRTNCWNAAFGNSTTISKFLSVTRFKIARRMPEKQFSKSRCEHPFNAFGIIVLCR